MPQLTHVLLAINAIFDPGAIFFGGEAPEALRRLFQERAMNTLDWQNLPNPELLVSGIEGDAAHFGAAFLPLHNLIYTTYNPATPK